MFPLLTLLASLLFPHPSPDVVLITLDGVRWQEIYQGTDPVRSRAPQIPSRRLLPNLYASFIDQGIAVGYLTPIIASGGFHVSLPGYLEITRGHPSWDCQNNYCTPTIDQSVFWFFQHPAVFASWEQIRKTIPANSNTYYDVGTDWYRWDNATELAAIAYLDRQTPDFLWVALGDGDEIAHQNDYPRYIWSLQMADAFIGYMVGRYPDATFIITTDHGRSGNFRDHSTDKASERVWLMMRGPNVPSRGLVAADPLSLSNVLPTIVDAEFVGSSSPNSILLRLK